MSCSAGSTASCSRRCGENAHRCQRCGGDSGRSCRACWAARNDITKRGPRRSEREHRPALVPVVMPVVVPGFVRAHLGMARLARMRFGHALFERLELMQYLIAVKGADVSRLD